MCNKTDSIYYMKKLILLTTLASCFFAGKAQQNDPIKSMNWDDKFVIRVTNNEDKNFVFKVDELYHSNISDENFDKTYYPASLKNQLIEKIKGQEFVLDSSKDVKEYLTVDNRTLWNAVHSRISGEWSHFINCTLFALEKNYLRLDAPYLQRPKSNWKPNPMTKSFKRTRKWKYYIPETQKLAIKEYKARKKEDNLGDIKKLPDLFISDFLNTNDKEYRTLVDRDIKKKARIDIVRLILGGYYLGKTQIEYIGLAVLKAAVNYSAMQLPSVIVFDDINAAVVMSLDQYGYCVEKIVYSDLNKLTNYDIKQREALISKFVDQINDVNKKLFSRRLSSYYNQ